MTKNDVSNNCEGFIDNILKIHSENDKTRSSLLAAKSKGKQIDIGF